jgi:ubiquinone/menaquinone biosynthesis C-methylase UbiE
MLGEMRENCPRIPAALGDAHSLPFRDGAVDLALFVTTLEHLNDPAQALAEAVRVARQGIVVVVLNRRSVGALFRRWGPQACRPLLGRARDYSVWTLRAAAQRAAGQRMERIG